MSSLIKRNVILPNYPSAKTCLGNGGCQHVCKEGPKNRICSCWKGFKLAEDQTSCVVCKLCKCITKQIITVLADMHK